MLHTGAEAQYYISAVHCALSIHISAIACIIEACPCMQAQIIAQHALYAEHAGT